MRTLKYEGKSWRELVMDTPSFAKAVADFLDSPHSKVHNISHRTARLVMSLAIVQPYCGWRGGSLSIKDGQTLVKNAHGEAIASIALRDKGDFPDGNEWAVTTDDGFADYTRRRADGLGIVGKYQYSFGLKYRREGMVKKEYFRNKREDETIKRSKNEKGKTTRARRRNQTFGNDRGRQRGERGR